MLRRAPCLGRAGAPDGLNGLRGIRCAPPDEPIPRGRLSPKSDSSCQLHTATPQLGARYGISRAPKALTPVRAQQLRHMRKSGKA
eukprot:scaffold29150_cov35-Prasinocladus_malaysianus.AAC.1